MRQLKKLAVHFIENFNPEIKTLTYSTLRLLMYLADWKSKVWRSSSLLQSNWEFASFGPNFPNLELLLDNDRDFHVENETVDGVSGLYIRVNSGAEKMALTDEELSVVNSVLKEVQGKTTYEIGMIVGSTFPFSSTNCNLLDL